MRNVELSEKIKNFYQNKFMIWEDFNKEMSMSEQELSSY